ncbi:RimP N-terminal domain [Fragilaria crotonensis]|nr:RimP N-terminal domain [Fragilaria crotonensis]
MRVVVFTRTVVVVPTAILLVLSLFTLPCTSWITTSTTSHNTRQQQYSSILLQRVIIQTKHDLNQNRPRGSYSYRSSSSSSSTTCRSAAAVSSLSELQPDESNYQTIGEGLIRQAGTTCGANDLKIEWSTGLIKVVVLGDAFVSNPMGDVDDDDTVDDSVLTEVEDDIDDEAEELDNDDANEDDETLNYLTVPNDIASDDNDVDVADDDDDIDDVIQDMPSKGVDVVQLARAINAAFAEDSTGLWIAETHEIEVTTPGAPDELTGIMWKVYKGFPVICRHQDPKTKQQKTIEGRLHERTDEFTVINIKGRMKKLKNIDVLSVKLPKAKKEKGG